MTSDRVRIESYDPAWPLRFKCEAASISSALGTTAKAIEHIGSTAVPHLRAKPTIDILVGVVDLTAFDAGSGPRSLHRIGYEPRGELGVPGRRYFRKGASYPRDFNVHVVRDGGGLWQTNLAFRDYLRDHPSAAAAYGKLKSELISRPGGDRLEVYAAGKAAFIEDILRRAA